MGLLTKCPWGALLPLCAPPALPRVPYPHSFIYPPTTTTTPSSCAMYPADDAFLGEVRLEIREQALRLGHHASLAVWGGNNENEAAFAWCALPPSLPCLRSARVGSPHFSAFGRALTGGGGSSQHIVASRRRRAPRATRPRCQGSTPPAIRSRPQAPIRRPPPLAAPAAFARRFPKTVSDRPFYLAEYIKLYFDTIGDEITKARKVLGAGVGGAGVARSAVGLPAAGCAAQGAWQLGG